MFCVISVFRLFKSMKGLLGNNNLNIQGLSPKKWWFHSCCRKKRSMNALVCWFESCEVQKLKGEHFAFGILRLRNKILDIRIGCINYL